MLCKCLTLLGKKFLPNLLLTVLKKLKFQNKSNLEPYLKPYYKDLQEQMDKLAIYKPKFFPEGTTANAIVSVENYLTSTE